MLCYHPGYHHNEFDNKYQVLQKSNIIENIGKICPNMKLTPPYTSLPQYN